MGKTRYWTPTNTASKSSKKGPISAARGSSTAAATNGGCMSAVFQFFDFHHFQFCLHHPPSSSSTVPHENHSTVLKGMEAPRNSLELEFGVDEEEVEVSVLASSKQNQNLHIPQIKTSCNGGDKRRSSASVDLSEISSSPGTKTPTLVARLMGLDLLPESCSSPSSSSTISSIHATPTTSTTKKSHLHRLRQPPPLSGTRSLPETPRVSSSSSRRSVDTADHRFSLQINKENVTEAIEFSRFTSRRRNESKWQDENRSPSEYAKQILKQVKESVSKRVGLTDITNSSVSRNREQRRDQELMISHLKSKKSSKAVPKLDDQPSPAKNSTVSPRLKFLESKNATNSHSQPVPSKPLSPLSSSKLKESKKVAGGERFRSRLIKKPPQKSDIVRKNKQEEPFVRPSSKKATGKIIPDHKKTPISGSRLNPALIPVKKHGPAPVTKIVVLQTQVSDADADGARESRRSSQLSSCLGRGYKQETHTNSHTARKTSSSGCGGGDEAAATRAGGGAEFEYVTRILNRTGIYKDTPVSFTSWFSPSHPLDPSLFHQLELSHRPPATTAAHRKLLFHLVDEMLVQILRPHVNMRPWCATNNNVAQKFGHVMKGSELAETLCAKIRRFPARECTVLEDIDAIIGGDLPEWKIRSVARLGFQEEGERIVREIENDVVDTLLHETAALAMGLGRFEGDGCWRRNGVV